MRRILLFGLILCFNQISKAQTIPVNPNLFDEKGRQGEWTIFFDDIWNVVDSVSNASFYRTITYKDDKPVGPVKDYWLSGELQMEAYLLQDRPLEIMHGEASIYWRTGELEYTYVFDNGKVDLESTEELLLSRFDQNPKDLNVLKALGQFYQKQMRHKEKALKYMKAYLKGVIAEHGKSSINYGMASRSIGWVYLRHYDFKNAEPHFLEALKIFEAYKNEYIEMYVHSLSDFGDMLR